MSLPLHVCLDYMDRKHLPELVSIAQNMLPQAKITEDDILAELADQYVTGRVAVGLRDEVLGGAIYDFQRKSINILHLWLNPTLEVVDKKEVLRLLLDNLILKVNTGKRLSLRFAVRESLTELQKMLSELGFKPGPVLNEYYADTDEAAFMLVYNNV